MTRPVLTPQPGFAYKRVDGEWVATPIVAQRERDLRKDWEEIALDLVLDKNCEVENLVDLETLVRHVLDLVLDKSCEVEPEWNWGMVLDTPQP